VIYPDEFGNFSDWIEIYNDNKLAVDLGGLYITDNSSEPDKCQIPLNDPDHTTIPGKGFLVFRADNQEDLGSLHLDFELSSGGEEIGLVQRRPEGLVFIDQLSYGIQTTDVSWGRFPDGDELFRFFEIPTPGVSNNTEIVIVDGLYINEFVSNYGNSYADELGNYADWIEIYNYTEQAIDAGGLYITDVLDDPRKWQLPENSPTETTIPAKGFIVLFADGSPNLGPLHLDFQLSSQGEAIGLNQVVSGAVLKIDEISFGQQSVDISYGRLPDGSDQWEFFESPTPGSSNSSSFVNDIPYLQTNLYHIFPNPVFDHLILSVSHIESAAIPIRIISQHGRIIKSFDFDGEIFPSGRSEIDLDLSDLPFGVYFVSVCLDGKQFSRKIIHSSR